MVAEEKEWHLLWSQEACCTQKGVVSLKPDCQHAVCGKVVYAQVFRDPRLGLLLSMCYRNSLKNGNADLENVNVLKSETPQRMVSLRHNNVHFLKKNSLKKFYVSIFISVVFGGFVDCNWLNLDSKGRKGKS